MRKGLIVLSFFLVFGAGSVQAGIWGARFPKGYFGERYQISTALQSGYVSGDTTYHISFADGASELEFPLDNELLGFKATLSYRPADIPIYDPRQRDRARLSLEGWFFNRRDAGKMKDSDWIEDDIKYCWDVYGVVITENHPGLDIYSESDADLDAIVVDLSYLYNFWFVTFGNVGLLVGYRYQKFEYEVYNCRQTGYGPHHPHATTSVPGRVLDYKVDYNIPYLGISGDLLLGDSLLLNLKLAYGWASAKDVDDHIVRYKLSKGDCSGDAYLANLGCSWEFPSGWVFRLGGQYLEIDTSGTQRYSFYGGEYAGCTGTVDDRITSSFWIARVAFEYRH